MQSTVLATCPNSQKTKQFQDSEDRSFRNVCCIIQTLFTQNIFHIHYTVGTVDYYNVQRNQYLVEQVYPSESSLVFAVIVANKRAIEINDSALMLGYILTERMQMSWQGSWYRYNGIFYSLEIQVKFIFYFVFFFFRAAPLAYGSFQARG